MTEKSSMDLLESGSDGFVEFEIASAVVRIGIVEPLAPSVDASGCRRRRSRRSRRNRFIAAFRTHFEDRFRPVAHHRVRMEHGGPIAAFLHLFGSVQPVDALVEFIAVFRVRAVGSAWIAMFQVFWRRNGTGNQHCY